jgi:DNA-binding NarL/FixJ family response regulator
VRGATKPVDADPVRPAESRVEVFDINLGGEELVVVSFPIESAAHLARLTPAERDVARAVARGLSNEQVARERGCRARTVACQLASIYRKLGISSRTELAIRLSGGLD